MKSSTISPAARVAALEAELAAARAAQQAAVASQRAAVTAQQQLADEHALLKQAYEAVRTELALLKHRLFVAKAERVDLTQLQLEFATILARAQDIATQLGEHGAPLTPASAGGDDDEPRGRIRKSRTTPPPGRRDLRTLALPEQRVELVDETLEGVFPRCGFEESSQLMWQRASWRVVVIARVKYQTPAAATDTTAIVTTPLPLSLLPRSIAGPTVWAALIVQKLLEGMPYHRQQDKLTRAGVALGLEARLPTGQAENLLGSGSFGLKAFEAVSGVYGRVAPHLNVGYQWNGSTVLAGDVATGVKGNLPDELSFTVGADVGIEKRLSIAFDVLGRHSADAPRLSNRTFKPAGSEQTFQDITFGVGSLNVISGAFGLKANVAGTMLVTFNLQFKLNDAGVRARVVPLVGIEYGF